MSRKPLIFSIICIFGLVGFSLATWLQLPELEQYPIHWNALGEADGFASKSAVLGVLAIIPITQIFITVFFHFIPGIEPLRQNFEESRKPFNLIWVMTIALMTFAGCTICFLYWPGFKISPEYFIKGLAIGISLVFIGIGNVLGKVRQNFMLGIRTPWTLSSELSWEKTHRVSGRLFVFVGIVGVLLAIFVAPEKAIMGTVIAILFTIFFSLVYSYKVWKEDPNKRQ